jgi:hypothetical protein
MKSSERSESKDPEKCLYLITDESFLSMLS